jgi:hypothetical protein
MTTKMKPKESLDIFKLSDINNKWEREAGGYDLDGRDKKTGIAEQRQKDPNAPHLLKSPDASQTEVPADSDHSAANIDYSMFGWLKVIEATSASASEGAKHQATLAEPSGRQVPDEEKETGVISLNRRLAALQPRLTKPDEDHSDEEFGDDRRLAKKFAARFDEPIHAPRETLMSALMPYVAATGFFVCIAGGMVFYFASGRGPFSDHKAGSALTGEISFQPKAIQARVTNATVGQPAATKANPAKTDGRWTPQFMEAGLSGSSSTRAAPAPQVTPPEPLQTSAKLDSWSDTVATFKQFVDAKNAPQPPKVEDDKARFLLQLEAWQNKSR